MNFIKDIGVLYESFVINEIAGALNFWLKPDGELVKVENHMDYALQNFPITAGPDLYNQVMKLGILRVVMDSSSVYFEYYINRKDVGDNTRPTKKQFEVLFDLAKERNKNLVDGVTAKTIAQNNDVVSNHQQNDITRSMDQDLQPSFYKVRKKWAESYEQKFLKDYTKLIYETSDRSYMEGNCAVLALKIHDITGWPIEILSNPEGEPWSDEDDFEFTHIVVAHPSGKYVDCEGLRNNADISQEFGVNYLASYDISRDQLVSLINDPDGPFDTYLSLDQVEEFAKNLLSRLSS